jgi:type II secretory pathway pseudopilin PulG
VELSGAALDALSLVLATGILGAAVATTAARRERRRERLRADAHAAQEALLALRTAYRAERASGDVGVLGLEALEDRLAVAASRTLDPAVMATAHRYVTVGNRYARPDEDTTPDHEADAYAAVAGALVTALGRTV